MFRNRVECSSRSHIIGTPKAAEFLQGTALRGEAHLGLIWCVSFVTHVPVHLAATSPGNAGFRRIPCAMMIEVNRSPRRRYHHEQVLAVHFQGHPVVVACRSRGGYPRDHGLQAELPRSITLHFASLWTCRRDALVVSHKPSHFLRSDGRPIPAWGAAAGRLPVKSRV